MRRPAALATALLLAAAVALPALGQQQVNPMDPILDFFQSKAGKEYAAQFIKNPTPGSSTVSDPVGDFEHSSGEPPGYTPDHIDIADTWIVAFDSGPIEFFTPTDANEFWAPTGPFRVEPPNFEEFHTYTGDEVHDGTQYADSALMFGFTLADTPPHEVMGRCEYVVWIDDLSRGPTFVNHPAFPGDPAGGTNVAFGLGINPDGQGLSSTFTLDLQEGGGFLFDPAPDVRAFVTPNFVGITVPKSQIGELAGVNFYTFCIDEGFTYEPEHTGADQTGLIEVTADDLGTVEVTEVVAPTTTTTLVDTTTTTTAAPTATTAGPALPEEVTDEGGGFPWWMLLVGGGVLALVGWWLFAQEEDDPCKELFDAWMASQKACDDALAAADEAADECLETEMELEELEQERKEACKAWPPACWSTPEGSWIEDDQGNRITSRDVHMRKMALGEVWSDYKANKLSAGEVEAKWREMDTPEFREEMRDTDEAFKELLEDIDADLAEAKEAFDQACDRAEQAKAKADEACATADAARKAYEDCIGAAMAGAAAAGSGEDGEPEGPSGPGVATAPGETEPSDPCEGVDPKRKYEKAGNPEQTRVNVDFSIITGRHSGTERNVEAGEKLIIELNDLARDLDFAGDMLNARSAGLHIGSATAGYRQGKYVATGAGVVQGGIDAAMATTDLVPDVPTTPVQAGTEFLEKTAQLGAVITTKVTEWMTNYQIFTVRRSYFYQVITATPYNILECRKGQGWVCVEKVWEFEVGRLMVVKGRDRWFTVNSEVRRRQFQNEVRRLSGSASNTIRNDAQRLIEWRARHEPGPCQ